MDYFLRHWFTPHHTNNHRARVLHIDTLLVYIIGLLLFQIVTWVGSRAYPDVLGYATDIRVNELLSLTNTKRQEVGVSSLVLNAKLSQSAALKAADMFAKNYWAHTSPDGKLPWDFILGAGYRYAIAGENLAKNFNDSKGVVDAWMASPSHRDNLLKAGYRDIGFAVVNGKLDGEDTTLVVQMFGTTSTPIAAVPASNLVGEVKAKEPAGAPVTQVSPVPIPQVTKTPSPIAVRIVSPIVVSDQAITTQGPRAVPAIFQMFQEEVSHPIINLVRMNRIVSIFVLGFLIVIFALDGWFVARRKLVRVAGHSHAHMLFLGALFLLVLKALPGSVL